MSRRSRRTSLALTEFLRGQRRARTHHDFFENPDVRFNPRAAACSLPATFERRVRNLVIPGEKPLVGPEAPVGR